MPQEGVAPQSLYRRFRYFSSWIRFQRRMFFLAVREWFGDREDNGIPVPGPILRNRVHGSPDREGFLAVGRQCAGNIEEALGTVGHSMKEFRSVLDFGCGCGRTLRNFTPYFGNAEFHGCDVNAPLVRWCENHISGVSFQVTDPLPPLPFRDGQFDLIYLISIFTHLDEEFQMKWLAELKRISKAGGIVLISTLGKKNAATELPPDHQEIFRRQGTHFYRGNFKPFKLAGLPDFYQAAYHTDAYIRENWSRTFQVENIIEHGINQIQDLVILRNDA